MRDDNLVIDQDINIEELKELIRSGERHFKRICVETGDLIKMDLQNIIFEECILCIDFSNSCLANSKFLNSNIKTCIFRNADLKNSSFEGNAVCSVDFQGADIQGMVFQNNTYHSIILNQQDIHMLSI